MIPDYIDIDLIGFNTMKSLDVEKLINKVDMNSFLVANEESIMILLIANGWRVSKFILRLHQTFLVEAIDMQLARVLTSEEINLAQMRTSCKVYNSD